MKQQNLELNPLNIFRDIINNYKVILLITLLSGFAGYIFAYYLPDEVIEAEIEIRPLDSNVKLPMVSGKKKNLYVNLLSVFFNSLYSCSSKTIPEILSEAIWG